MIDMNYLVLGVVVILFILGLWTAATLNYMSRQVSTIQQSTASSLQDRAELRQELSEIKRRLGEVEANQKAMGHRPPCEPLADLLDQRQFEENRRLMGKKTKQGG